MLGMSSFSSFGPNRVNGDSAVDMHHIDSIYVYCDVIEPRVVGDSQTPLIRIVPAKGNYGRIYHSDLWKHTLSASADENLTI